MDFHDFLKKITIKQILFVLMCVLLILVIILFCIAGGKLREKFMTPEQTEPSTETTTTPTTQQTTQPSTEGTTAPTIPTPPETTLPTEPGHEHEFKLKETVSATCENYGYKIYICSCGKQDIPISEQVEPYGHNYGAPEQIDATCETQGCTRYTCTACGRIDDRNITPAIGHDFLPVDTIPASCGIEGYTLYQCSHCEMEEMRDIVPALAHQYEFVETKTATCTENGYTRYQCLNCQDVIDEDIVHALGHSFTDWVQITDSSWSRSCGTCGLVENSAEMKITTDQKSSDLVHDAEGKPYRMYLIYVGTPSTPDMVHYTIHDYLDNGTLAYSYDPARGLLISYTNGTGETATITLPVFHSTVAVIPADPVVTTDPTNPAENGQ